MKLMAQAVHDNKFFGDGTLSIGVWNEGTPVVQTFVGQDTEFRRIEADNPLHGPLTALMEHADANGAGTVNALSRHHFGGFGPTTVNFTGHVDDVALADAPASVREALTGTLNLLKGEGASDLERTAASKLTRALHL
jgi:hypothetical protein